MRYVVEYILPTDFEWSVYLTYGKGTKTGPMTSEQFLEMDRERLNGKYVFLNVEVVDNGVRDE